MEIKDKIKALKDSLDDIATDIAILVVAEKEANLRVEACTEQLAEAIIECDEARKAITEHV
ncbi:MAG: hypothetical protein GY854_19975 [Deltaproteobacteria bacterium]|nr:hypothetical protein [Deltaproteobacteria bacterium]